MEADDKISRLARAGASKRLGDFFSSRWEGNSAKWSRGAPAELHLPTPQVRLRHKLSTGEDVHLVFHAPEAGLILFWLEPDRKVQDPVFDRLKKRAGRLMQPYKLPPRGQYTIDDPKNPKPKQLPLPLPGLDEEAAFGLTSGVAAGLVACYAGMAGLLGGGGAGLFEP